MRDKLYSTNVLTANTLGPSITKKLEQTNIDIANTISSENRTIHTQERFIDAFCYVNGYITMDNCTTSWLKLPHSNYSKTKAL
mmetsp:Transcript_3294/g.5991  ORF Transcript_3294/g.5991 Transcript_3294/m.5991 type:complete len:83 (-) Transcript_3294:173-421(-)